MGYKKIADLLTVTRIRLKETKDYEKNHHGKATDTARARSALESARDSCTLDSRHAGTGAH